MIKSAKNLLIILVGLHITSWAMDEPKRALPILSESMTKAEWLNFAHIGGGYYPIPSKLKQYLPNMLELARGVPAWSEKPNFHHDKKHQIEFLYSEENEWDNYPKEIQTLAQGMRDIAVSILVNLLQALDVDKNLFSQITGGLSDTKGKHFLKVAYYDAAKPYPGLSWHKDIRWITVLFIDQEGLEGKIGTQVVSVPPLDGHFFINLGVFFEAFINDAQRLNAFIHQVKQVNKDRVSFGVFVEGNYLTKGFYQQFNNSLVWKSEEDMNFFLLKDNHQAFSSGPHQIFRVLSSASDENGTNLTL